MKQFYETYKDAEKVSSLVTQIHPDVSSTFIDTYVLEFLNLPEPFLEKDLHLCKSKNNEVVEYALSRNMSPALVAEYRTKLIDKKFSKINFMNSIKYQNKETIFEEKGRNGARQVLKEKNFACSL